LTTDLIVGFPGETMDDFQETIKLAEYCKFDSAYFFKYSPRPGTPAFEMIDDVSTEEKKLRCMELEKTLRHSQSAHLQKQLNTTHKVLAEGFSTKSENVLNGHTTCHKIVNFEANQKFLGQIVNVKITECKTNTLFGKMI
jgi:tRNA-2-methylthio-N6-dimethylallyladenosine synthase